MVLCKFYQQGNCRYGQYCKFEHSYGNRSKNFGDEKNIALMVAEDMVIAKRGGQWVLSCYGPFKERKCIPGMDDLSPEEVRWETYQAQKNGTVDQINAQFQQMCEAMDSKREALKNPTPAILQLLEEIQNSGPDNTFGNNSKLNKGNFAFGTPQLGVSNNNQTSNVFGQKPFGAANNPFGGGSNFNSMQASSSVFARPTTFNNSTSVFGGKPSFGSAPVFGSPSTSGTTSIFGNKTANSTFGTVQNAPTFGGLASQGTSIFGGTAAAQSGFGQPAAFGSNNNQANNSFMKIQGSQQSSVFGGTVTTPVQPGNAFGGTVGTAGTANPTTNSVFGANSATSPSTGTNIFGQTASPNVAFGGAPVFGSSTPFGATQANTSGSVFGGQSSFGATAAVSSSSNVFGGTNTATSSFGAIAQSGNVATGFRAATTAPAANAFETSDSAATPFGIPNNSTAAAPFGTTAASPFGNRMPAYSKPGTFGFGTPTTEANVFGAMVTTTTSQSTFGGTGFASTQSGGSVFTRPITTTVQTSNVFMTKSTAASSPFGVASSPQANSSPFGMSGGNTFGVSVTLTIDETAYSSADALTDDEKAAYCMNVFPEGHIPITPPTKELR